MSEHDDYDLHLPEGPTTFALAVLAGLGIILFFVGTSDQHYDFTVPLGTAEESTHEVVGPAPTYMMLRETPRGPSSGLDEDLSVLAEIGGFVDGDRGLALTDRAELRSYDGAPPRIPHAVRQGSAAECLTCHETGLTLRGRRALPMSHTELTSCTQCHVVADAPMPGGEALPVDPRVGESSFVGMLSPERGPRAWDVAPPATPHRTFMRERCDSCHGDLGREGMQTPHPYRQSCEQCHAPNAEVDQRPGVER
jgi:cytochrome c-type protein NapB